MNSESEPGRMLPPASIAAIIPTVDRIEPLRRCLAALSNSTVPYDEVVVVHQGRDPAVAALAATRGARYLMLDRRGLSHARNRGIAGIRSAWRFFPDDDCIPDPAFARDILAHAERRPELRILCGTVCDERRVPLAPAMGARASDLAGARAVLRTLVSAGMVVHREVFDRIGGFDERLGLGAAFPSGEESDFVLRALDAGFRAGYVPTAPVLHAEPFASAPAQQIERAYHYGRGWGAMFAKHGARRRAPGVLALFAEYLARAAGGMALSGVRGRRCEMLRYAASLRGRWGGFFDYLRTAGTETDRC